MTYRTFLSTHSIQITPAAEIAAKISNNHQYQFITNPLVVGCSYHNSGLMS
jgi:hypothetical protein